jgi:murein tripeptide amidase MpaA
MLIPAAARGAGKPAVEGYADFDALRVRLEAIAESRFASLESLAVTGGKRDVYLLTVGTGKTDEKPAVLVIGGVHPPQLVGSELAVRLARRLVDGAKDGGATRKLLSRVTFYFIPRASPDAAEAFFRRPYVERIRNDAPESALVGVVVARRERLPPSPQDDHLSAAISLRLEENRVHVNVRRDTARLGLNHLRAPDFTPLVSHCSVEGHVLRLERGDAEPVLGEHTAECSDQEALPG